MNTVLKKFASTLGVLGFGVAIALPAVAQSNFTPGPANNPTPQNSGENVPGTTSPANRPDLPTQGFTAPANSGGQSIDAIVRTNPSFEFFNALVRVADSNGALSTVLAGDDDYTVFAPTDQALAQLPAGVFKSLVQPENRDLLISVLENHIVKGRVSSSDLASRQVESAGGNPLTAQGGAGVLTVGNARVIAPDINAENGIIHVVDNVILPADVQSRLGALGYQSAPTQPAQ